MPSYRFCRPDDIPRLVRALNECYFVHFPRAEPFTVDSFRAEMKEIDVWPSSCLVALAGDDPIAVSIGTKRSGEALVLRIGVRPDHQRQGHGAHLLDSLSQKLAVLGPPRLVAEVPLDLPGVPEFFTALGYEPEVEYADRIRPPEGEVEPVPDELVAPISVDELVELDLLEVADNVAWERTRKTLVGSKNVLEGLAIATAERVEAYVLTRRHPDVVDVVSARCCDPAREELFLRLLLRRLIGSTESAVRLPKLSEGEIPESLLDELGFVPGRRFVRCGTVATPG